MKRREKRTVSMEAFDGLVSKFMRIVDINETLKKENVALRQKNEELFLENAELKTTIMEIRQLVAKYESGELGE